MSIPQIPLPSSMMSITTRHCQQIGQVLDVVGVLAILPPPSSGRAAEPSPMAAGFLAYNAAEIYREFVLEGGAGGAAQAERTNSLRLANVNGLGHNTHTHPTDRPTDRPTDDDDGFCAPRQFSASWVNHVSSACDRITRIIWVSKIILSPQTRSPFLARGGVR